MIEALLGKITVPAVLVVLAAIFALVVVDYSNDRVRQELRTQIIKTCADRGDSAAIKRCASDLREAIK